MKMKKQRTNYWYFTRSERNGIVSLTLICLLLFIAPGFYHRLQSPQLLDHASFKRELAAFSPDSLQSTVQQVLFYFDPNRLSFDSFLLLGLPIRTVKAIDNYRKKGGRFFQPEDLRRIYTLSIEDFERLENYIALPHAFKKVAKQSKATIPLQPFDPNQIDENLLLQWGLDSRLVIRWKNYLEKGGRFRRPEDLKKLYGLRDEEYQRLLPFVHMPTADTPDSKAVPVALKAPARVDINRATIDDWQRLKGIGPTFATRIVKFRDKLGGFAAVDQVAETWGMPDSVFQQIKPWLDPSPLLRQISINDVDQAALEAHPYLNKRDAAAIISYRNQHGPFKQPSDLQQLKALTPETLHKILPYIRTDID